MIAAIFSLIFIPVCAEAAVATTNPDNATMVMMQIPAKEYAKHLTWYDKSPKVLTKNKYFLTSFDLTSYIPYIPAERDQGNVGTCWVWAGTAAMELDHSRSDGVMDQLSVQYFDSQYNGGKGPTGQVKAEPPINLLPFTKRINLPSPGRIKMPRTRIIGCNAIQIRNRGLLLLIPR